METPEQKVQFRQILVTELTKAGFLDAKGNVVVVKTQVVAAPAPAPAVVGGSAVTESYQQFMSRRNTELKATVAEWPQRKTIINEEWVSNKGVVAKAPRAKGAARATGEEGAPKKEKTKRKKTAWDLFMKEHMNDSDMKEEFKSGQARLKKIAAMWHEMTEADKAPWVAKLAGLVSPVVPLAEPAVEAPVEADEEAEEEEGEDKDE
jgi:hypothetical protein